MNKIKEILNNNKNLIDRINHVLDFYSNDDNYSNNSIINDKGSLAKSLLKDVDKMYDEIKNIDYESLDIDVKNKDHYKEIINLLKNNK